MKAVIKFFFSNNLFQWSYREDVATLCTLHIKQWQRIKPTVNLNIPTVEKTDFCQKVFH